MQALPNASPAPHGLEGPKANLASSAMAGSGEEDAIDDSIDADEEDVQIQRKTSQQRRRETMERGKTHPVQQKLVGVKYSPLIRPLSVSDMDSCIALENAAFETEEHRCTPRKFKYRLTLCPELSFGIFCTIPKDDPGVKVRLETEAAAKPVEYERPNHISTLLAHVVSTRSTHSVVEDSDMDYPKDWETNPNHGTSGLGNCEEGRTICLHSLAVLPSLQLCGLGTEIMRAYLDRVRREQAADRVALLCQYPLIIYYQRFGFKYLGKSGATYGGGEWHNMVYTVRE